METTNHHRFRLFRFLVLTTFLIQSATAQTTTPDQTQPTQYATFTPSVAVIIIVFITALFFLGFFSIYIRHCSDNSAAARGGTVRPLAGGRSRRNAARGLDARLIETLPTFPYSEVKHLKIGKGALECAVCLNEFEDDETLRLLPRCDHVFHPVCIDEWLSSHTTCPVCRANLAEIDAAEEATVSDVVTVENEGVAVADRCSVTIEVAEEAVADDGGSGNRSGLLRSKSIKSMIWLKVPSFAFDGSLIGPTGGEFRPVHFKITGPNQAGDNDPSVEPNH